MDINATLLGQFITFAVLILFTMKYVWPPIIKTLQERQNRIADGLAAAERGKHELELAQHKSAEVMRDAKIQAAEILDQASKRAGRIVDEAKDRARTEGERLLELAKMEIEQEVLSAKLKLREQIAQIAIAGAEKIIEKHIDVSTDEHLLQQLVTEI